MVTNYWCNKRRY